MREFRYELHEVGCGRLVHLTGLVHCQHEFVRVPIAGEVHACGDEKRNQCAAPTAD